MVIRLCLGVAACLMLVGPTLGDLCQFPELLTSKDYWETHITLARKKIDTYVQFRGRIMEQITYSASGEQQVNKECLQSFPGNKFLFKIVSDGETVDGEAAESTYQCIQVLIRSNNILQLKTSQASQTQSNSLCEDNQLILDKWPLIVPEITTSQDDTNLCGITGGFDFHMYDKLKNSMNCDQYPLKPRMEVDCSERSKISIDFREFSCVQSLSMRLRQTVTCLGSWEQDGYLFSLITDGGNLWPTLWLLRFPRDRSSGRFNAVLSSDIIADTSTDFIATVRQYQLIVSQSSYLSSCQDEAQVCSDCELYEGEYCQKTCGLCSEERDDCTLLPEVRGDWKEISHRGIRQMSITSSMIYADGVAPLQCLNLPNPTNISQKQTLVTLYRNGCKPVYTCIELLPKGANIMQYRLGQSIEWPLKVDIKAEDLCSDEQFAQDETESDDGHSQHLRLLVRDMPASDRRESVECGIHGRFSFKAKRPGQEPSGCAGRIQSCHFRDIFHIQHEDQCNGTPAETFHCIGAFQSESSRIIITEKSEDPDNLYCWIVHRFEGDDSMYMYKMKPADCNGVVPYDIHYNHNTDYLIEYKIPASNNLMSDQSCETAGEAEPTSTRSTENSGSTPTGQYSTSRTYITQNIPPNKPTTEKPYNVNARSENAENAPFVSGVDNIRGEVFVIFLSIVFAALQLLA